uniref:GNAT family N-acetyltransferase n=1 Tax=Paractinoplanes polyasparticus TaxID=2856853 RepID=UPI001C85BFA2|nr:GNAT family N-acetyltransferase [Actinoplanes polyasparticus]
MDTLSTARAEGIEAEFMYLYEAGAPAADRELLGITTHRVGGGVVLSMRNDVTGYWNKALGFGFAEPVTAGIMQASAGHPQFLAYAALAGDTVVGGAALYVDGEVCSLNSGAVLPDFQRRGGQRALVAARLRKARELGCRFVVGETGQPAEGQFNPSYENMLRAGLKPMYVRRNWIWRP